MAIRGFTRAVAGIAASAAMIGGLALTAPAAASAASAYKAPDLAVSQSGNDVTVKITNTNDASWVDLPTCTAAVLDGEQAIKALAAYDSGSYGEIARIVLGDGVRLGTPAINTKFGPKVTKTNTWTLPDGVYVVAGVCGGAATLNGDVGVAIKPAIVPTGFGSLASGSAFASVALENGGAIMNVLPLLLGAGSAGGGLS